MEYENINFDPELLGGAGDLCAEKYILPLQSGRLALNVHLTPDDLYYPQAANCLKEIEDANSSKLPGYELLKTVLQWISEHYAQKICVADAAEVCSFSSSHFMRWFRQMTGQSFIAFLNEYRLNTAAEALQTTDETVLTIASRCGFENLSYFNRIFKAHFGITPRDYRKR